MVRLDIWGLLAVAGSFVVATGSIFVGMGLLHLAG